MTRTAIFTGFLALAASLVSASPMGDTYFILGSNFPTDFGATGVTFDGNVETPVAGLSVQEQILGLSPEGYEVLAFQFGLTTLPDLNQGFSIGITGLDWTPSVPSKLGLALFNVTYIFSNSPPVGLPAPADPGTSLVWSFDDVNGFSMLFSSNRTWQQGLDALGAPQGAQLTGIAFELFPALNHAPIPGTVWLIGIGLASATAARRRRTAS